MTSRRVSIERLSYLAIKTLTIKKWKTTVQDEKDSNTAARWQTSLKICQRKRLISLLKQLLHEFTHMKAAVQSVNWWMSIQIQFHLHDYCILNVHGSQKTFNMRKKTTIMYHTWKFKVLCISNDRPPGVCLSWGCTIQMDTYTFYHISCSIWYNFWS